MSFFHSEESGVFSNVKNPFNNFLFVGQVPLVEVGLLELVVHNGWDDLHVELLKRS